MPTTKRPPLSQECIEARIVLRVAQLREAASTACEYWRQRKGADRFSMRGLEHPLCAFGAERAVWSLTTSSRTAATSIGSRPASCSRSVSPVTIASNVTPSCTGFVLTAGSTTGRSIRAIRALLVV